MFKLIFRNSSTEDIRKLLIEIGEYRLYKACMNMHLEKPRRMKNFYLECNVLNTFLVYKYLEGHRKIMKVDDYDNLPVDGWVLVKWKP